MGLTENMIGNPVTLPANEREAVELVDRAGSEGSLVMAGLAVSPSYVGYR